MLASPHQQLYINKNHHNQGVSSGLLLASLKHISANSHRHQGDESPFADERRIYVATGRSSANIIIIDVFIIRETSGLLRT